MRLPSQPVTMHVKDRADYEDLLSQWADLEAGLGIVLGNPASVQEFVTRIHQYDRWMQDLLARDTDIGLYLLFQLATQSTAGYSASHALICSVLCHLLARRLSLPPGERDSLARAALTMNIAMTVLQDELALQSTPLSPAQKAAIDAHACRGAQLLQALGVQDRLWLETVAHHHAAADEQRTLQQMQPAQRLVSILRLVDRYAAMISPRKSREGRSTTESVRSILDNVSHYNNAVGLAMVDTIGLCPPGTYVRLDSGAVAVVVRREPGTNQPLVAILTDTAGQPLPHPRLHHPSQQPPGIQAALARSVVREHFNHHLVLQLL